MAKIVLNVPNHLIEDIGKLVYNGHYPNINSYFLVAAENQALLENERNPESMTNLIPSASIALAKDLPKKSMNDRDPLNDADLGLLQRVNPDRKSDFNLVSLDNFHEYNPVHGERDIVWGQINRFLPVKIGIRVLTNLIVESGGDVDYDEFRTTASNVAASLALIIEKQDRDVGRKRGEQYSAALPSLRRGRDNLNKGLDRFKNQFLVYLRRDEEVSGLLAQLKFIAVKQNSNGKAHISITEPGFDFSIIENPILDKTGDSGTLSKVEKQFLLKFTQSNLPIEFETILFMINLINQGYDNRTSLNEELGKKWPEKWSKKVINTQRGGFIARMNELGLIGKTKHGLNTTYYITDDGNNLAKNGNK